MINLGNLFLKLIKKLKQLFINNIKQKNLISIAVADKLTDGLSAIYTFFDPDAKARSLGMFAILWLIQKAQQEHLGHVYLGYWIKGSQKMEYKINYKPIELYVNGKWITVA